MTAVEIELKALEMEQMRVLSEDRHRETTGPIRCRSILKIRGIEIQQATTHLLLEIAGTRQFPISLIATMRSSLHRAAEDLEWAAPAAPASSTIEEPRSTAAPTRSSATLATKPAGFLI